MMQFVEDLYRSQSGKRLALLAAIMLACCLAGGSSQWDRPQLLILRPALVVGIVLLLLVRSPSDWRQVRWPLVMLGIFAATILVQLIPLPPSIWRELPGRERYLESFSAAPASWQPISLAPDLTINALLALLPAIAVLIGYAGLTPRHRRALVWLIVGATALSIGLGFVQIAGGASSWAFLYGFGDRGVPTGLFANRNHHAALIAVCIPALALLLHDRQRTSWHWAMAIGIGVLAPPAILLSGSRAGILLCVVGLVCAALLLLPTFAGTSSPRHRRIRWAAAGTAALLLAGFVQLMVRQERALSFDRLLTQGDISSDRRIEALPTVLQIGRDFFPAGIGHGAFEPVFRSYEPLELLHSRYFNRAHNDVLELLISGGALAALPMLLLLGFIIVRVFHLWRDGSGLPERKVGLAITLMLIAASLVDYPLRTALGTMLFSIALCWLASDRSALTDKRVRQTSASGTRSL